MGVARKKLRRAERAEYARHNGRYQSGSDIGPGMIRAQARLDWIRFRLARKETVSDGS